jgi:DNA mismatch endonuclease (patch repair protein)
MMAAVRSKNTEPEMLVRRLVHSLGYRYRLHSTKLPGRPDLVFPGKRKVIFVHGCFWHRHANCSKATLPKTRTEFWEGKLDGNVALDRRIEQVLTGEGWGVLILWQCELQDTDRLSRRLHDFLGGIMGTTANEREGVNPLVNELGSSA